MNSNINGIYRFFKDGLIDYFYICVSEISNKKYIK